CTPSPWACLWRCCSASTCPRVPLASPSRSSSSTSRTLAPASRSCGLMLVVLFYLDALVPIIERTDATAARSSWLCAS
ncbi:hypothetical protein CFC21_095829, partial [Triticum aestivum]